MRFRPTQDYILVLPIERKQSETLAVVSGEKNTRGKVVAVGPGKKNPKTGRIKPLDVKVGDVIAFGDGTKTLDFFPSYFEADEAGKPPVQYRILQEADICFIDPQAVAA